MDVELSLEVEELDVELAVEVVEALLAEDEVLLLCSANSRVCRSLLSFEIAPDGGGGALGGGGGAVGPQDEEDDDAELAVDVVDWPDAASNCCSSCHPEAPPGEPTDPTDMAVSLQGLFRILPEGIRSMSSNTAP